MSQKKIEIRSIAEEDFTGSREAPVVVLTEKTTEAVRAWAHELNLSSGQTEDLISKVKGWCQDELGGFCAGFGEDSAALALIIHSICNLQAEASSSSSTEEEFSVTLQDEALTQLNALALNVLRHVDSSEAEVDLVNADMLN
jgi:hypothetical protein